jgi:hypothetical protein
MGRSEELVEEEVEEKLPHAREVLREPPGPGRR